MYENVLKNVLTHARAPIHIGRFKKSCHHYILFQINIKLLRDFSVLIDIGLHYLFLQVGQPVRMF